MPDVGVPVEVVDRLTKLPTSRVDDWSPAAWSRWCTSANPYDNLVLPVHGWDWVYPGELLCQSGGSSARDIGGPVCNLRVERFNTDPADMVEAQQIHGQTAVRDGDSGGPVYRVWIAS
jgi:hypothetical protein